MRRLLVGALSFVAGCSLLAVTNGAAKETDTDVPLTGISAVRDDRGT